ncbi:unnamed protein product, partial [Staurois parvus]
MLLTWVHSVSCHVPHFRSPHTAGVVPFCHRVLADYGPPIVLASQAPKSAMGPLVPPPHACCRQGGPESLTWVPVRPPIAAVSILPLSSPCATFSVSSSHTAACV